MCSRDLPAPQGKGLFLSCGWKTETQGGDPRSRESRGWSRLCPTCPSAGLLVEWMQADIQAAFPCLRTVTGSTLWLGQSLSTLSFVPLGTPGL